MNHYKNYKWRLYADKNIDKNIIDFLRKKRTDVLAVGERNELTNQEDCFHYKKAKQLGRYLLTNDRDFWNDRQFKLKESPGLILFTSTDKDIEKYFMLLKESVMNYNPFDHPFFLDGCKIKCSPEGMILKILNQNSQKVEIQEFRWKDF